jgi:xylulokinase
MKQSYLLGVDIGTYSSKGVLVQADGRIAASHTIPHSMEMPKPSHFEHDADRVWWGEFVQITRQLFQQSGVDPWQIAAVGASGIGPCVLPVDEQGCPLRTGILYGIDTRAQEEIQYLEKNLGRETIFKSCAMHLDSQAAGPKILWIRNHEPNVYQRARWFLTSQAYLVFRLTGLPSIDVYTAGYYAPLYDVFRKEWNVEAAKSIISIEYLPKVFWSAETVGTVSAATALETGLAEGTPVVAGTADAAAEAVSAGVTNDGDMLLMFGSSIFFILQTNKLVPTERFWSSNFLEPGTFAFAGGMSTAGSLTTWFRDQLAYPEAAVELEGGGNAYTALAAAAEKSPLGARGLITLPYFEGERTPLHDAKARGMWFGLNLKHTRADLYRSLLEGTAFGIRHNLEAMSDEGVTANRLLLGGGGVHNQVWLQIVSDVCGVDLCVPKQRLGACYGDAFLASIGAGQHSKIAEVSDWVALENTIHCDEKKHAQYNAYYRLYRELYEQTKTQMHELADLITGEDVDDE